MVGNSYSLVDMALWGWARMVPFKLGDDAFARYPNVKRLVDEISARPAAAAWEPQELAPRRAQVAGVVAEAPAPDSRSP